MCVCVWERKQLNEECSCGILGISSTQKEEAINYICPIAPKHDGYTKQHFYEVLIFKFMLMCTMIINNCLFERKELPWIVWNSYPRHSAVAGMYTYPARRCRSLGEWWFPWRPTCTDKRHRGEVC